MTINFSVRDITFTPIPGAVKIVAVTDIPCTLYCRLTETEPQIHKKAVERRGIRISDDVRFCFVVYEDNIQAEPEDTLTHTWTKPDWPPCTTKWFYFWGTQNGTVSVSTTCFFKYHYPASAISYYLPTWNNRFIRSLYPTWPTARLGADLILAGDYQRPQNVLIVDTFLTASYWLYRSWLNFSTKKIPSGKTIIAADLGIYPITKGGALEYIHITRGLCLEPIDENDWYIQTDETTSLGQIFLPDIILNQYNWIPLNADGIAWLNKSALELKQHESYDWQKNSYYRIYGSNRWSESFTPITNHNLGKIRLRLKRAGDAGTLYVNITDTTPDGCSNNDPLAQANMPAILLSTATWGDWQLFTLNTAVPVLTGHTYAVEIWCTGGNASNYVDAIGSTGTAYQNGHACYSIDSGHTWISYPASGWYFIEYETATLGGTNFCLRTANDRGNVPPPLGPKYNLQFYSAQKGEGYHPLLRLTLIDT